MGAKRIGRLCVSTQTFSKYMKSHVQRAHESTVATSASGHQRRQMLTVDGKDLLEGQEAPIWSVGNADAEAEVDIVMSDVTFTPPSEPYREPAPMGLGEKRGVGLGFGMGGQYGTGPSGLSQPAVGLPAESLSQNSGSFSSVAPTRIEYPPSSSQVFGGAQRDGNGNGAGDVLTLTEDVHSGAAAAATPNSNDSSRDQLGSSSLSSAFPAGPSRGSSSTALAPRRSRLSLRMRTAPAPRRIIPGVTPR